MQSLQAGSISASIDYYGNTVGGNRTNIQMDDYDQLSFCLLETGRCGAVARAFAKQFYNSAAWIRTSKAYAASKLFICERCGRPAKNYIVHHKKFLTPQNINDPMVALNWDNLQLLCHDCHNATHHAKQKRKIFFDSSGQVVGVGEAPPSMSS